MAGTKVFNTVEECMKEVRKDMMNASAAALNQAAFQARTYAVENVNKDFTLRNNFTTRNILYEKCPRVQNFEDLVATVGATERVPYMARQEEGGIHRNPNGGNLVIPTTMTRRGSNANAVLHSMYYMKIREKVVQGHFSKKHPGPKSRAVAAAYMATKIRGFVKRDNAIYKIYKFKKSGDSVNFEMKMFYNLKHAGTRTEKREWLEPACAKAAEQMQVFFNKHMDAQWKIRRQHKIQFKDGLQLKAPVNAHSQKEWLEPAAKAAAEEMQVEFNRQMDIQ